MNGAKKSPCTVADCERPRVAFGLCQGHSRREKAKDPEWRARRNAYHVAYNRRWKYRLAVGEIEKLLAAADSQCQLCSSELTVRTMRIDHDHACCPPLENNKRTCGKCIRGVLCNTCNTGIGMLGDDPDLLLAAAQYIAGHRAGQAKAGD